MSEISKITLGEIENVLRDIPGDIGSISRLLRGTAGAERINGKAMALLLAAGAEGEYAGDGPGWLVWAKHETGLSESTLYHRLASGRVLLQFQDKAVIYRHLLEWDIEKIYTLVKLPKESREGFLAQTENVWSLDRDDLRFAADCFLARLKHQPEPVRKDRNASPALPGFEDFLDKMEAMEEDEYLREIEARPEKAHVAAGVGLSLLDAYLVTQSRMGADRNAEALIQIQEILAQKQKEVAELLSAIQGENDENTNPGGQVFRDATKSESPTCSRGAEHNDVTACGVACDSETGKIEQTILHSGRCKHLHQYSGMLRDAAGNSLESGAAAVACNSGNTADDAASSDGRPGGSCGAAEIHQTGEPDQGRGRDDDSPGSLHPGGGEPRGRIPDAGARRPRGAEPADLQQLPELDGASAGLQRGGEASAD